MSEYIWKKSNYKGGRMGVLLEAGYQMTSEKPTDESIKITQKIYFKPMLLPYPKSEYLKDEEIKYFCAGLQLMSQSLLEKVQEDFYLNIRMTRRVCHPLFLVIGLRSISFSECDIQIEDFTGSAILWVSETFNIPIPDIDVYSSGWKSEFIL